MNNFWDSIKAFFVGMGHTIMSDIITALPAAQQLILQAFTALINAAIAYVISKYAPQTTEEVLKAISPEDKLALDNQRHNDAFNYVKEQIALNPSEYPAISDSLLHTGIELYYQKHLRDTEGNGGNGFQGEQK